MKDIALLGSTGSIGTQTLDLVRVARDRFRVRALAAGRRVDDLLVQVEEFEPDVVAVADPAAADDVADRLPAGVALLRGADAAEELAAEASYELCVHGMVGAAGVRPSARVLERGRTLALANKESLVVAGAPLMELARTRDATLLPVDSEHAALFQCLGGEDVARVRSMFLTASGGPFRDTPPEELADVTPAEALRHPNWDMGPRISVGSATLMNKALEVLEAHHLFGLEPERIRVLVHRQSVVHGMVEFVDGSVVAQMGPPDMRGPIHQALHHPERAPSDLVGFEPTLFRELTFEEPDPARFPALELGYRCVVAGGDAGAVLNAADEVAVAAFLDGKIGFQDITTIDRTVLERRTGAADTIDGLLAADAEARTLALDEVAARTAPTA